MLSAQCLGALPASELMTLPGTLSCSARRSKLQPEDPSPLDFLPVKVSTTRHQVPGRVEVFRQAHLGCTLDCCCPPL